MTTRRSYKKAAGDSPETGIVEFGATGLRQFSGYVREEWLRSLIGRKGMLVLREMRDNDPIIAAIFTAIEMLLRPVPFRIEPDDKNNRDDQAAADFVQSCFVDMEHSWPDFIADVLSFLQYGFGVYEIVYKFRRGESDDPRFNSNYTDGKIGWRKFAGRAQETLLHWIFNDAGDAIAMVQLLPTGGPLLTVPLSKCLHFRTTPYKQNPEGRSVMRSMYDYYFLKKRVQQIEAIGVHRDLAGMVNIRVPASWMKKTATEEDKAAYQSAKDMANLINNNEQSALVTPFIYDQNGKELFKVELLTTAGQRQFHTTEIINRYDHGIAASLLADFITLGTGSSKGTGSHAQSTNKSDMFSSAVVAYLDIIASQLERKAVPDLLRLNSMKGRVKVSHGDIARRDLDELGTYIANIAAAGALVPDDSLEGHLREEGGLPPPDDPDGIAHQSEQEEQARQEELAAKKPPPGSPPGTPPGRAGGGGGNPGSRSIQKRGARLIGATPRRNTWE